VILIEALAQTLGYWALRERPEHWVLLTGVDAAKFSQVVQPDEEVVFTVEVLKARRGLVVAQGRCHVGERQVAQAQIKGFLQPRDPR
jgi:3-hydroxymyristoyl/3-hydroxydecanoyl-(acyl carrier protein) dehydratase